MGFQNGVFLVRETVKQLAMAVATTTLETHDLRSCLERHAPLSDETVLCECMQAAQKSAEKVANRLGLSGVARIDAFVAVEDGTLFVIEVNTIPGLTPNNVLFQQALAEDPPIYPDEFLRMQVLVALSDDGSPGNGIDAAAAQGLDGYFTDSGSSSDIEGWAEGPEDDKIAEELLAEESLDWMKGV